MATREDAQDLLDLQRRLDQETDFMLYEPGERSTTLDAQRQRLAAMEASGNQRILVAEEGGWLVGFAGALGGSLERNRHCAHIVIGVLQAHVGRGLGTSLMRELEDWAKSAGVTRMELTVMTHNVRAIALYGKLGFAKEGRARHSLRVSGKYVDQFLMAKLL